MTREDCGLAPPARNINNNQALVHVRTTIPKELSDTLDHLAIERSTSKQQLIRDAIEALLGQHERELLP